MNAFFSLLRKELQLLLSDKLGLSFMFIMPIILVLIISAIQNSAYKQMNESQISLLIVNQDTSKESNELVNLIKNSGVFKSEEKNTIDANKVKQELISNKNQAALYIPPNFSACLHTKAAYVSNTMLSDFALINSDEFIKDTLNAFSNLKLYYDPILQEAYRQSIVNIINSFVNIVERTLLLESIYEQLGYAEQTKELTKAIQTNNINVLQIPASDTNIIPNPTQHNIPAWTIFAMFFVVVSLGSNIVNERLNGSFVRLKTMPISFSLILNSKLLLYLVVTLLQVLIVFSIGVWIFPFLNLPKLIIPSNILFLIIVCLICAFSAISYAMLIGSLAKTREQANGIGAASIIVFAALGGVFVPVFVMPSFLKFISFLSPMRWCLESFYLVFLRGGNYYQLFITVLPQILFIIICQLIIYFQLSFEKK